MRPAPDPVNIVCFRTDRIGDVVLTMPALAALARRHPHCRITMVVSPRTRALIEGQPWVHEIVAWDHTRSWRELIGHLRRGAFDTAVVFYPRLKIALAAVVAGIPVVVGTAYRWYSFLFTHRVAVHRRFNVKHEAEYNLDLLQALGIDPPGLVDSSRRRSPTGFAPPAAAAGDLPLSTGEGAGLVAPVIPDEATAEAEALLQRHGITLPYVVVHPVSRGSALNAAPEHYGKIARRLTDAGHAVVLTGTREEAAQVLAALRSAGLPGNRFLAPASLPVLAAVLRGARVVVGPSTGPLHMAASLGVPTVALFPPLHAQSPVRWRPRGGMGRVVTPHGAVCARCLGWRCPMYNCMDTLDPSHVLEAVQSLLKP